VVWVQDEPENQGPWTFMAMTLGPLLGRPFHRVTRPPSAAPAVGSSSVHASEQKRLMDQAFGPIE
jgi:2-oxoglutarate dehydrogenase E1 component